MRIASAIFAVFAAGALTSPPVVAQQTESPLLREINNTHCLALYDVVELRLKGRGDDVVSTVTRNSLKDFFVTRPGVVDCSGQREIAWTDDKDRAFIGDIIKAAAAADKAKVDMSAEYGIALAPARTQPRR